MCAAKAVDLPGNPPHCVGSSAFVSSAVRLYSSDMCNLFLGFLMRVVMIGIELRY